MTAGWGRRAMLSALAAGTGTWLCRIDPGMAGTPAIPPEQFVNDLAGQVVAVLSDHSVDEAQRLGRVDALTANAFDLDRTARIALGRYWKVAPDAERREFASLFKEYVLTSYGRRFHQFAGRTFRVVAVRSAGEDVVVGSIVEGGATPMRIDWRLTAIGPGWRVLDIMVEGVSLLVTYRNEFAAVIERSGGRLAGLLDELRSRVAAERAQLAG